MSNRVSLSPKWRARWKVATAGWTPNDFVGLWLLDALGTRFRILSNTADTLELETTTAPDVGYTLKYTGSGWTVNQFQSMPGASLYFYVVDQTGRRFNILGNTADTLVLAAIVGGPAPSLPPGAIVTGGNQRAALLTATPTVGSGVWTIVDDAGEVLDVWTATTGAVTATEGTDVLKAAQTAVVSGTAIDIDGCTLVSIIAGFLTGTPSSPNGTLQVLVNNRPGPDQGANPGWLPPGPPPDDVGWVPVKVSVDGAAAADSATIDDEEAHVIIPVPTPGSPLFVARWLMLEWTPAESPGTGDLSTWVYAYGAKG